MRLFKLIRGEGLLKFGASTKDANYTKKVGTTISLYGPGQYVLAVVTRPIEGVTKCQEKV